MRIETKQAGKKFWFKLKLSLFIISTWWIVFFSEKLFNLNFYYYGLKPKSLEYMKGIITYPFLHGSFEHLSNNSLSGFIIFSTLFLVYEKISLKVLLLIYLFSGILLWLIGESGSTHIGASSVIYGVAFFLFLSGILVFKSTNIAISLFIAVWYGSMIWGITPFTVENGVSWEGHLSGAIVGVLLAFLFHRKQINKRDINTSETDLEDDYHFYERFPLEDEENFDDYFIN